MSLGGSLDFTNDLLSNFSEEYDYNWQLYDFPFDPLLVKEEVLSSEQAVDEVAPELSIVSSPKKPRRAYYKRGKESEDQERSDKIVALNKEIVALREKQSKINVSDPKDHKRLKNAASAAISRKSKKLVLLKKDQRISELKADRKALKSQNADLQNQLQRLTAELAQFKKQTQEANFELSLTLPQTSMLIKYQSPMSSPKKPAVSKTMELNSPVKKTLRV